MSDAAGLVLLAGRILFSIFFLFGAMGHFMRGEMMAEVARSRGWPFPALAKWPSGLLLLAGVVSIDVGIYPDLGALILAGWTIPTGLFIHRFWAVEDPGQKMTEQMNFMRNLTYLGAALAFFAVFASLGSDARYILIDPLFKL